MSSIGEPLRVAAASSTNLGIGKPRPVLCSRHLPRFPLVFRSCHGDYILYSPGEAELTPRRHHRRKRERSPRRRSQAGERPMGRSPRYAVSGYRRDIFIDIGGQADWKEGFKKKQVGVSDMTLLTTISNDSVNDNLQKRWTNAEIYTYIGSVLISVNPFKGLQRRVHALNGCSFAGLRSGHLYRRSPRAIQGQE